MRITKQLLSKVVQGPLERVPYLDLSCMKIGYIECLDDCQRLNTLLLQDNVIDSILNIEWCRELWIINLSGNRVKSLQGLSRFTALGSLDLSNNRLDWIELKRLSHLHLLSLSLTGNNKLDTDPYYRYHVIDILPHLWMLDGQIITAGERRQVQQFFKSSATTPHPVRHKVSSHSVFVPTKLQNLLVTGVYGEKTTQLFSKFPLKYSHNIELDKRRLMYITELIEDDLKLESEHRTEKGQCSFVVPSLQELMKLRLIEREQCNMLLLLLVIALEFELPVDLMIATLETAKISTINGFICKDLFSLPFHVIYKVTSLLLSGAAIDRDEHKEGGLYPQLYEGLQAIVCSSLSRKHNISNSTSKTATNTSSSFSSTSVVSSSFSSSLSSSLSFSSSFSSQLQQYKCLVASEVVHLMCLVPLFFEYLDDNSNVLEMVAVATNVSSVSDVISHIAWKIQNQGGDIWNLYHEIASYLLHTTTNNVFSRKNNKVTTQTSSSTNSKRTHSATSATGTTGIRHASSQIFQTPKRTSPRPPPRRAVSAGGVSSRRTQPKPELGDTVLCAPERPARIIAIPEPHVAVLQLISSPIRGDSGPPPDAYFYTDPRGLVWDGVMGYWTKDDLTAELSAGRLNLPPSHNNESLSSGGMYRSPSPDSILSIGFTTRPSSQMSYISEDLQTIPSVEELSLIDEMQVTKEEKERNDENTHNVMAPPLKVEINVTSPIRNLSQRPKTPEELEEAQLFHQQHILEQYSINKTAQRMEREEEELKLVKSLPVPAQTTLEEPSLSNLIVPTPSLSFPTTWSSAKSLPNSLTSTLATNKFLSSSSVKEGSDLKAQGSDLKTPPPVPYSSRVDLSSHIHTIKETSPPVVVLAWSPVKSGCQPKQTKLSATRTAVAHTKNRSLSSQYTSSGRSSRPSSRQSSSVILKSRSSLSPNSSSSFSQSSFQTTAAYTHQRTINNKHNFISHKPSSATVKKGGSSTRKLGDVGILLGTSVW